MTFLHNLTQCKSVLAKHGDCSGTKTHLSHPTVSTLKSCQNVFVGMHFSTSEYAVLGRIIYFPDSHITSYYWQHGDWWNVKYLDYVCALVLLFEPVKKKTKKTCAPAQNNTFIFQSLHLPGTGWAAGSDKEGICHRVMNGPVRLETVWSCLLTPGLISLIESQAAMHEQTYAHSLQLGLACPFLFVCTFHYVQ